ncbi:site-specific integrase [Halococcus salsus]|uniref:site-specific integrase n=1 Tax=Halococcus salsus TaxID=2162894 RepID=UPI0013574F67|nr:site-specific integrase [Halococcus salsus]
MPRSIDDSSSQTKVWLNYPDDINALADEARESDWSRRVAVLLMGRVGLRVSGVLSATPAGLSYNDDGDYWELRVRGKNTKGGEKTTRQAYVPKDVQRELNNYAKERDIALSEPYVDVSVDSIRRWVREAASNLAPSEGKESSSREHDDNHPEYWEHVSSHDLRRAWANHYLVEEEVSARVMMSIGGWSSYDAIEPYLTEPTSSTIGEELNGLS